MINELKAYSIESFRIVDCIPLSHCLVDLDLFSDLLYALRFHNHSPERLDDVLYFIFFFYSSSNKEGTEIVLTLGRIGSDHLDIVHDDVLLVKRFSSFDGQLFQVEIEVAEDEAVLVNHGIGPELIIDHALDTGS